MKNQRSSNSNNEDTNVIEEINFSPESGDGLNVFEENRRQELIYQV